jgi:hypothetical protein
MFLAAACNTVLAPCAAVGPTISANLRNESQLSASHRPILLIKVLGQ